MREIADQLGISVSSVSLALNNKPGINDDLRKQVLETCDEMGYNVEKIVNKKQVGGNIGFLSKNDFLTRGESFYTRMLHEAHDEAEKKGFHLIINSLSQNDIDQCVEPHFFKKIIQGILIAGYIEKPFVLNLMRKNIPIVMLGYDIIDPPIDCVEADNFLGAFRAVNYLISQGHRKIGLIGGIPLHYSPLARMQGYKMALELAHLPLIPEIMVQDLPMSCDRMGYQATRQILESYGTEIDAFFCVTDHYATGCIKAIKDFGLEVPENISVMGFDNMHWVEHLTPSMTTVNIPTREMGRAGIKRLIHLIENKHSSGEREHPQKILLPVDLVIRESVRTANSVVGVGL